MGLDIGVTSVGWGLIDREGNIIDKGVRLFEEATADNNEKRREKRGWRRVKRRRQQRVLEMRRLLAAEGLVGKDFTPSENPYEIRVKGLHEELTNQELATALLHIVKRRGSTLDIEDVALDATGDKDAQQAKETLASNTRELENEGRHVAEIQLERLRERGYVRGEDNIFKTEDYLAEFDTIMQNQNVSEELIKKARELISRKRHYSEGPGSEHSRTPYGRYRYDDEGNPIKVDLIEEMRGNCSVYPEEKRAPLRSFTAELFNFLNDLNNLKIPGEQERLTEEQKHSIIEVIRKQGYLKPKTNQPKGLAEFLKVKLDTIAGFRINEKDKPLLTEFKGYQKLLEVFEKHDGIENIPDAYLDWISEVLTSKKLPSERKQAFLEDGMQESLAADLSQLDGFNDYHSLSLKAMREIIEEMLQTSKNQMEIITENNLRQKEIPQQLTLDENAILSPVAKRAHREALRVVESIMKRYGYPDRIVIETTRAKNSKEERDQIKRIQRLNKERKDEARTLVEGHYGESFAERLSGTKLLKIRLYKEQDGKCAYTNHALDLQSIVEGRDDYEIDHIIPFSVSLDDSYNNKVLCEYRANQLKGNRSPYAYFKTGSAYGAIQDFESFKELVQANRNLHPKKKELLLREDDITKYETLQEFTRRNLVDTSYAVRTLMGTLKDYFKHHEIPTTVVPMRGKLTNLFRNIGAMHYLKERPHLTENPLEKNRNVYKHHAIDALIAARLSEQSLVRELLRIDRSTAVDETTGEIFHKATPKEDGELIKFVKRLADLDAQDFKYSWKVDRKPNRAFSDETIYSTRTVSGQERVVKKHKDIYNLESGKLEKILGKDKEKLLVYQNDYKTFEKLQSIYEQYAHERYPFAAYRNEHGPIRKYARKGDGPVIRKLKYIEDRLGNHVDISHKYDTKDKRVVLLQISPYRTDFYRNPDGTIKFVTIRYADLQPIEMTVYHPEEQRFHIDKDLYEEKKRDKKVHPEASFLFSMHRNEILDIVKKEKGAEVKERYRFIVTNNDKTNSIEVKPIEAISEKPQIMKTIGRKILDVKKYAVSPLGEMQEIKKESLKLRL